MVKRRTTIRPKTKPLKSPQWRRKPRRRGSARRKNHQRPSWPASSLAWKSTRPRRWSDIHLTAVLKNTQTRQISIQSVYCIWRAFTQLFVFLELPGQKLLQPSLPGAFCRLRHQLHSALLQSKLAMMLTPHPHYNKTEHCCFCPQFMLKFLTCSQVTGDYSDDEDPWNGRGRAGEEEDEGALEYFVLQESTGYMAPTLRCLAILHTIISFLCVVGYYYLKVQ